MKLSSGGCSHLQVGDRDIQLFRRTAETQRTQRGESREFYVLKPDIKAVFSYLLC